MVERERERERGIRKRERELLVAPPSFFPLAYSITALSPLLLSLSLSLSLFLFLSSTSCVFCFSFLQKLTRACATCSLQRSLQNELIYQEFKQFKRDASDKDNFKGEIKNSVVVSF